MSAIAGILGRLDDATNRDALNCMSAAMAHRGPDGAGEWASRPDDRGHGCLLAHRRLVVLDESTQPIVEGGRAFVSDASVFTHPQGHDVLHELTRGGPPALSRLRGMFALALWDEESRQLLMARDPLGHKPLYFCRNPDAGGTWSFAFASELRALIASGLLGAKPKLDPDGLASFVWNGFVMSPHTMVRGVAQLLPGECRIVCAAGKDQARELYWSMPPAEMHQADDESGLRSELRESIKLQSKTAPSAQLCAFLSGGIDSSSIANLAQQQAASGARITTFCMAMEDPSLSEGEAARQIAAAIGSEHHEVVVTEQRFVEALDAAIAALDQPTFDAVNQYHVCRAARDAGVRVALGGIGGDAIFGGDKTLRQLPRIRQLAAYTGWVPEPVRVAAARLVASVKQKGKPGSPLGSQQNWAKLPDVVRANGDLLALYQLTYALFLPEFQRELLRELPPTTRYGLPEPTAAWFGREIRGHAPIDVAAILETRCFVGERLLRDADTVGAALSFELRSPLSDARILEALNRLPVGRKYLPVGYKPLLRKYGLEGLDPGLFDRPKSGFVLPFDRWIRKNLGQVMDDVMRDERLCAAAGLRGEAVSRLWEAFRQGTPGLYWTRVWGIYVLIRWCDRHGVTL